MSTVDPSSGKPTAEASAPVVDYAVVAPPLWQAGTLAYNRPELRMLFFWLLWGDFSIQMRERSVGPTFQYMLGQLNASDLLLGLLVGFIPHAIGLVLGPIVSYRSDRHRSPRGRRIPYLLISTPLCFLGMTGLALSPKLGPIAHPLFAQGWQGVSALAGAMPQWIPGMSTMASYAWGVNASVLLMVAIFWTIFEIFAIVTMTIFNALIADVVPHGVMGRFFGLFRMVSLADGIFFNLVLIQYADTYYSWIFFAIGLFFAASFLLMCVMVKEGDYPPAPPAQERGVGIAAGVRRAVGGTRTYLREAFSHSYYRWLTTSVALTMMAFVPINTFSIFFSRSVGMDPKMYGQFSAIQFALSFIQAYPIGWLADKFHPIRLLIAFYFLYGTTMLLAFFFVTNDITFGIFHVAGGTLAGLWGTAFAPFLPRMLPRAKYATFASAISVIASLGTMIIAPVCGWFLDVVVNRQYRYIYLWVVAFDIAALLVMLVVYRKFQTYGGDKHYIPPDPDADPSSPLSLRERAG